MRCTTLIVAAVLCYQFAWSQKPADPFAIKKKDPTVRIQPSFQPIIIDGSKQKNTRLTGKTPFVYQTQGPLHPLNRSKGKKITTDAPENGLSVFIKAPSDIVLRANAHTREDVKAACTAYLHQLASVLQIKNPNEEFSIQQVLSEPDGRSHVKLQQQFQGVKVYGSEIILHTENSKFALLNGRYKATPDKINTNPTLKAKQAAEIAIQNLQQLTHYQVLSHAEKTLLQYDGPESELIIYHPKKNKQQPKLAWHLTIRPNFIERWECFVDAHTGEIIDHYNNTCHIDGPRTASAIDSKGQQYVINTYEQDGTYYFIDASRSMFDAHKSKMPDDPVGVIWTIDARNTRSDSLSFWNITSTDNVWNDPIAVSAHVNAGLAYEYYLHVLGRNSINGQNGRIISVINVTDENGEGLDNAFWNGTLMAYGNGNKAFTPLAGSLDVAGHEMTHGVIGSTANLEYRDETGAINESFADIFGILIEREEGDWTMGEDIVVRNYYPSGAMRDISDPHNGGTSIFDPGFQPKHVLERFIGTEDNGGVHSNSGITNYAFYLFANSNGMDLEKAEQIYYRALTIYLTSTSQFAELRLAVVQATEDLFGADGVEVAAAKAAFDAVGIEEEPVNQPDKEEPAVEGNEYILAQDTKDPNASLRLYNPDGTSERMLSSTRVRRKPSVTDDGTLAVFVSEDNTLIGNVLVGEPHEVVLNDEPIWGNVAISRDGSKLAATSISVDTSIYVLDITSGQVAQFKLYNPTYTEGVTAGNVLYADAFEWDYSGEYLLYDAFNAIESENFFDIEYWDVGFIKVWDNVTNTFGSGEIHKLFATLPEDVSIGNPSFSKNSPNIIAFDYVDSYASTHDIVAYNMDHNNLQVVFNNVKLGFPSYSRLDDKLIFDGDDLDGNAVIGVISFAEDKMTPMGEPTVLIPNAQWGIWLTQGTRPEKTLSSAKELLSFSFQDLDPSVEGTISDNEVNVTVPAGTDVHALVATFIHSDLSTVQIGEVIQESGVTVNDFTNPVTYTIIAEDGSFQHYTVTVFVKKAKELSNAKELTAFAFLTLNPPVAGKISDNTVNVVVPQGIDITALIATFTHSELSTAWVNNTKQVSGITANDFTNPVIYTVIAEDQSFQNYLVTVEVDKVTNIENTLSQSSLSLFPNPSSDQITVEFEIKPNYQSSVIITDLSGRIVQSSAIYSLDNKIQKNISLASLAVGTYILTLDTGYGQISQRIIKVGEFLR